MLRVMEPTRLLSKKKPRLASKYRPARRGETVAITARLKTRLTPFWRIRLKLVVSDEERSVTSEVRRLASALRE